MIRKVWNVSQTQKVRYQESVEWYRLDTNGMWGRHELDQIDKKVVLRPEKRR